jgi:hypothetical protein
MDQSTFTPALHVVPALSDRCDRCGAAAKLRMAMAEGALAFCGHHANANAAAIIRGAQRVAITAGFVWSGAETLDAPVSTATVEAPEAPRAGRSFRNSR